jgi:hypothetical protein
MLTRGNRPRKDKSFYSLPSGWQTLGVKGLEPTLYLRTSGTGFAPMGQWRSGREPCPLGRYGPG